MPHYYAVLEYDGTDFAGFQLQTSARTVQGVIEAALARLAGEPVRIAGAGRTDAGVHARGQVISFDAAWRHPTSELQRALNALLPEDVAVRTLGEAHSGFHARYSALGRTYLYRIYTGSQRVPLERRYAWQIARELDLPAMQAAADGLIGESDCAAFGHDPRGGSSTVRCIRQAVWQREGQLVSLRLSANAFLRGMVRRIVGNLVQVGLGELSVADFGALHHSGDLARSAAPAPACGLVFEAVQYDVRQFESPSW
ncbi:MAG: tRNA pseudouridine(38-40) synthase TruA [Chloroflexi bacterium]|nr:tRNA pseudouridine(38-40) synthase TruA [Chloroflexota bacterium]